jgi:membrane protein insertase Oxa1/YidC/SpoIIIJ
MKFASITFIVLATLAQTQALVVQKSTRVFVGIRPRTTALKATIHEDILQSIASPDFSQLHSFLVAADEVMAESSPYTKVDKTGVIGFLSSGIEQAIDISHNLLVTAGVQYSYGFAIIIFTILIKALTLPLTSIQLESTNKMQKLTPLQKVIQEKYANDEQTKNQLLSQLFQASNVNPLAGCFPALAQIPIFLSLYRALQNLIAEDKLNEV